jgi:hypothetical protein
MHDFLQCEMRPERLCTWGMDMACVAQAWAGNKVEEQNRNYSYQRPKAEGRFYSPFRHGMTGPVTLTKVTLTSGAPIGCSRIADGWLRAISTTLSTTTRSCRGLRRGHPPRKRRRTTPGMPKPTSTTSRARTTHTHTLAASQITPPSLPPFPGGATPSPPPSWK